MFPDTCTFSRVLNRRVSSKTIVRVAVVTQQHSNLAIAPESAGKSAGTDVSFDVGVNQDRRIVTGYFLEREEAL